MTDKDNYEWMNEWMNLCSPPLIETYREGTVYIICLLVQFRTITDTVAYQMVKQKAQLSQR